MVAAGDQKPVGPGNRRLQIDRTGHFFAAFLSAVGMQSWQTVRAGAEVLTTLQVRQTPAGRIRVRHDAFALDAGSR